MRPRSAVIERLNCVLPGPTRSRGVGDFVEALAQAEGKTFADFEQEFWLTS